MLVWEWGYLALLGLGELVPLSALDTPTKGLGPSLPHPFQLLPLPGGGGGYSSKKGPLVDPLRLAYPWGTWQRWGRPLPDAGVPMAGR